MQYEMPLTSNIDSFRHFGNTFTFCFTTLVYQITDDYCAGSDPSERCYRCHVYSM